MSTERISAVDGTSEGSGGAATLGCSEGALELLAVQPAGRRPMDGGAWLRGLRS